MSNFCGLNRRGAALLLLAALRWAGALHLAAAEAKGYAAGKGGGRAADVWLAQGDAVDGGAARGNAAGGGAARRRAGGYIDSWRARGRGHGALRGAGRG